MAKAESILVIHVPGGEEIDATLLPRWIQLYILRWVSNRMKEKKHEQSDVQCDPSDTQRKGSYSESY